MFPVEFRILLLMPARTFHQYLSQRYEAADTSLYLRYVVITVLFLAYRLDSKSQLSELNNYNISWKTQSKNAGESMPCGGGDIGLNVWMENNEVLFYIARSGHFDENNSMLKAGRVRMKIVPNPFENGSFTQELNLQDGYVSITGTKGPHTAVIKIWVDVFKPVINVEVNSNKPVITEAAYESWRYNDRVIKGREGFQTSYKWALQGEVKTGKDSIQFNGSRVCFHHQNNEATVFDVTVKQQGLDSVKDEIYNPLKGLVFGGLMEGDNMEANGTVAGVYLGTNFKSWKLKSRKPVKYQLLNVYLHTNQSPIKTWEAELNKSINLAKAQRNTSFQKTIQWWQQFWERSYIFINGDKSNDTSQPWQVARNYQLMRYMLACNAYGKYPTKFNGGLFTWDPALTDSGIKATPDFRNWGGGTHTAQNQRLVYFPMIKSGDFDLLKPQLTFYTNLLKTAELRSRLYWGHNGACFAEQLENFGLPNPAEYGWKRPPGFDKGLEYNAWLEYEWDTVLEFCLMMLETERYTGTTIKEYIPFIESCLTFFNEHYQYLAKQRGSKAFDAEGHLVLYPGSGAETYKMAYNSTSTIAALQTILERLLNLSANYLSNEKRKEWTLMLTRIPPINFAEFKGAKTIAPARLWERINNTEPSQLYPVFPWGMYGVGKPDLAVAINTYKLDTNALKFRSHVGWKQDNIFAARLGLTGEATRLTLLKLQNAPRRFPAFWGPGFDWTPDHNWGGSGMIGLQEMLIQTDEEKIFLLPAWPKHWDVHFKLHAPFKTTVEAEVKDGKLRLLKVVPEWRKKDIVILTEPESP